MTEWKDIAPFIEGIAELSGIAFCACGLDGVITYMSASLPGLLGRGGEGGAGLKKISDISPELEGMLSAAVREGKNAFRELAVQAGSGEQRVFSCSAATLKGAGADPVIVFVLHDVTRYRDGSGAGEWRAIVESLEDGYYECDLNGTFTVSNGAMHRITGYEGDELVGKNYVSFYSPEDVKQIYALYHEVFVTGTPARLINFKGITKSGTRKSIEGSISPIRDETGAIRGFRGILRDLSDKNRIEKELLRARKLEAIGIMAGGIAHDYNNALTAVLGNISLAKMEADPANASMMEYLNDAEMASMKAVDLTRRLSTFARGGKPERSVVDCTDTVRSIASTVLAGYAGTYEVLIHKDLWKVDIDEFQIGQVITYILNNAVEAMSPPGHISIAVENIVVEQEESRHELSLQPGKFVRISISDKGMGLPPEEINNIFDPYYTTKEMASGMGLATSYAIIKRHHGYIDVRSAPGRGSTFILYLPVAQ